MLVATGTCFALPNGVRQPVCFLCLCICAAIASGCSHLRQDQEALAAAKRAIHSALESPRHPFVGNDKRARRAWDDTRQFYERRDEAPAWSDGRNATGRAEELARTVRAAGQDGLDPADYDVSPIDPAHIGESDVRLTCALFRYARDLSTGTVDPEAVDSQWHRAGREIDLQAAIDDAVRNGIEQAITKLVPRSPQYLGLKHQLSSCPDTDCRRVVAVNMDRWRWLPDDLGQRYLIVNIPAFRLDAIESGRSVLDMKVVTGKKDNPTPVLADAMTTVVFSPYWNIPQDIVDKEILPKLEKDPEYLERSNIEHDESGRYRQRPGQGNSLGGVKFLFPNHFNVYLHDTPSAQLFNRIERDFSHGCVRVEQPLALAKYVLRDQPEWTEERIREAMASGVEKSVRLKEPLPIYLVYFTAWEEGGRLQTVADVYGHDRRQNAASAASP
jgi:murein L,D-transpeptidase YcbB/YkuD